MSITCPGYDPARPCPVECQSQLLLEEFREFRAEFQAWRQEHSERTVKLEAVVKPMLQGNGQPAQIPAMIAKLGDRITSLERVWLKLVGASAAVSAIVAIVWHVLPLIGRH